MLSRRKFLGMGSIAAAVALGGNTYAAHRDSEYVEPYQVWESNQILGEVITPDLVQAVRVARRSYPNRNLRICGGGQKISVEISATATESNMEVLYQVIREEQELQKSKGLLIKP